MISPLSYALQNYQNENNIYILLTWKYLRLISEEERNYMGHEFSIVTLNYFPYIHYMPEFENSSRLQMQDSLDYRILTEITQHLNITYVERLVLMQLKHMTILR